MDNYQWTKHALYKLKYYQLSKQRITRVIRNPERIEEGIVSKTIAVMQPSSTRIKNGKKVWSQEIWAMYQIGNSKSQITNHKQIQSSKNKVQKISLLSSTSSPFGKSLPTGRQGRGEGKLKIISAWRYPGMSPKNNPIPEEILREIKNSV
ncbi:MAG: hypothetical protein Q7S18_01565 [bacterium]|nr:hypothetical protein [bacterium]